MSDTLPTGVDQDPNDADVDHKKVEIQERHPHDERIHPVGQTQDGPLNQEVEAHDGQGDNFAPASARDKVRSKGHGLPQTVVADEITISKTKIRYHTNSR
jgi:hypothetical protein